MTTLHDCLFCKPLVKDKGARDTKKSIYKINEKMLYAIHVLKKDSNGREELYFVLTS